MADASESLQQRMKTLERALEERIRTHQAVVGTYEARLAKVKADLEQERAEKLQVLRDHNQLKGKYLVDT